MRSFNKPSAVILLIFLIGGVVTAQSPNSQNENWKEFEDGKLFFKLKDDSEENLEVGDFMSSFFYSDYQVTAVGKAFQLPDKKLQKIYLLEFANTALTDDLIETIKRYDFIEYVERVPLYRDFYTPNDLHPNQWHLQRINAAGAWNLSQGSANVVVAVVDDAVLTGHQDLAANIWVNPNEIPNNNIDDDANGYKDDVNGYDVADNDNNPNPPASNPGGSSHGTHCAGIISAVTDNNAGIASIGFSIKIMPVKVRGASTPAPYLTNPYTGISYAIAARADVISMSWGGGSYSATYQNLFNYANSLGIVLVAAAGNSNVSFAHYPAGYNHVISVGSTDAADKKSSFSNYGTWVDVMSPGSSIWSSLSNTPSSYDYRSGTSMACPLVAGLCGLMLSVSPNATPADIENCLEAGCDNIDAQNPSYVGRMGAGRINANNALMCLNPVPGVNFSANYTTICPGQQVQFTDLSSGQPITAWSWSFPGGTPATSTQQNPLVTYASAGNYNVSLTATNANGSNSLTKNAYIKVGAPVATLSGSAVIVQGGIAGLQFTFTGNPPYSLTYTDGVTPVSLTGITTNPYVVPVSPQATTTYTPVSFADGYCSGTVAGSATITVVPSSGSLPCHYANIYGDAQNNGFAEKYYDAAQDILYVLGWSPGNTGIYLGKVDRSGTFTMIKQYNLFAVSTFGFTMAPNGDLIITVAPASNYFLVIRVDSQGNVIWAKKYSSSGRETFPHIIASTGDTYIVGSWHSSGGANDDVAFMRINGTGNILWTRTLNYRDDQISNMVSNGNGGCLFTGQAITAGVGREAFIGEIDANGAVLWQKRIDGNKSEIPSGIIKTIDGGYAVSGKTGANHYTLNNSFLLKLDANKNFSWLKKFDGVSTAINMPDALIQDNQGNYYVNASNGYGSAVLAYRGQVVKYSSTGNVLWSKKLNYLANGSGDRFGMTHTGGTPDDIILVGSSGNPSGGFGGYDGVVVRTDTDFSTCVASPLSVNHTTGTWTLSNWVTTSGILSYTVTNVTVTTANPVFSRLELCTSCPQVSSCLYANIYGNAQKNLVGDRYYDAATDMTYVMTRSAANRMNLIKIDGSGNVVFVKEYPYDVGAITGAPNGDLVIVTYYSGDMVVLRLDASGNVLFTKKIATTYDDRFPLICKSSGDSYIIGFWHNISSDDVAFMRIDANANVLWNKSFHGNDDQLKAIVSNGNGGCVFTGELVTTGAGKEIFMGELDVNGAVVWLKKINGNYAEVASGIIKTLDGGYAVSGKTGASWATINSTFFMKLDANLNISWVKKFSGLSGNINMPSRLIQDKHGSYYIATSTTLAGTPNKVQVVKYDVNGTLLWSKKIDHSASGGNEGFGMVNTNSSPVDHILLVGSTNSHPSGIGDYDALVTRTDTSLSSCLTGTVTPVYSTSSWTISNWPPLHRTVTATVTNMTTAATSLTFNKAELCTNCIFGESVFSMEGAGGCGFSASIQASDMATCVGNTVSFSSVAQAGSYLWKLNGVSFSTDQNTSYYFDSSGLYSISLIMSDNDCDDSATISIQIYDHPNIHASDTVVCIRGSAQLIASGGSVYVWSPSTGLNDASIYNPIANPAQTMWYVVQGTDSFGCSGSDSVLLEVDSNCCVSIAAIALSDSMVCTNDSVFLQNTSVTEGPVTYLWTFGPGANITSSHLADPGFVFYADAGLHQVTLELEDICSPSFAVANVYVYDRPLANAGTDSTVCIADTVYLQLGEPPIGFYTYEWSPLAGLSDPYASNPTATLTASAAYQLVVTDFASGCSSVDSVSITTIAISSSSISGLDSVYCVNDDPVSISGTPHGGTFSGLGIVNDSTFNPKAPGEGDHVITYSFGESCVASSQQVVTIVPAQMCGSLPDGIPGLGTMYMEVYPNPFTNNIRVNLHENSDQEFRISLKDVLGREIWNRNIAATEKNIEIRLGEALSEGIYFLEVRTAGKVRIVKLIKAAD